MIRIVMGHYMLFNRNKTKATEVILNFLVSTFLKETDDCTFNHIFINTSKML